MYIGPQRVGAASTIDASSVSGTIPTSICQAMKLTGSRATSRSWALVATAPAAQPKPDSVAHSRGARSPCQSQGATTRTRPANANATASHCSPRSRSCSATRAITSAQNGIVNTSTEVRPAPPPATAIVVAPKLTVVWKNPVTAIARHPARGASGERVATSAMNSTAIATQARWTLKITGSALASASFIAIQWLDQMNVSTPSPA